MFITQETLEIEHFQAISWKDQIVEADEKTVGKYQSIFFSKASELEDDNDLKGSRAYRFLGDLCSMYLKLDNPDNPFGPMAVTANGRTAIVDDFSEADLDVMDDFLDDIGDPELRARVADILWTARRDHTAAETAFEAYLESAQNLLNPESWSVSFERIERAFQIASMLGNQDLKEDARDFALDILDELEGEDPKFLSYNLLKLLLEHELGDLNDLSQRTEDAANKAASEEDWRKTRKLWMLKADIDRSRDEADAVTDAEIKAGEAKVSEAERTRERSNLAAAHHFSDAVEIFRRAGASEKAEETHQKLLEVQEKSVEEMKEIETTVDLTKAVQEARKSVSDKEVFEAFRNLAMITLPPEREQLEESAEQLIEENLVSGLMLRTVVDEDGKIVARRDWGFGEDAEDAVIKAEMIKYSQQQYAIAVNGRIEPARKQLLRERRITIRDFVEICAYNPFVPPGRELIFAQGLYLGFTGDFTSANHLLIPQIEHSLRYLLQQAGVITTSLTSEGIQEEYSLNSLLHMDEIEEILGEDIVFTLHSLLNSKFGANFRHRTAHGLLNEDQFRSPAGIYTWWLVLHLIFRPIISADESPEESESDTTS